MSWNKWVGQILVMALAAAGCGDTPPNDADLIITTLEVPTAEQGVDYSATIEANGGSGEGYEWSVTSGVLPEGLTLESGSSATLSGTPVVGGTFSFEVTVEDSGGNTATAGFSVDVASVDLAIQSDALASATVGVEYDASIVAAGGSGAGYEWNVVEGSLPDGLQLMDGTPSATLAGTPTTSGMFEFTIGVRDDAGATARRTFSIRVGEGIAITTTELAAGQVGEVYAASLAAEGGTTPYTWSVAAGSLPAGLMLSADSDVEARLEGTPEESGSFEFSVEVSGAAGAMASRTFTLEIAAAELRVTTLSIPDGAQGVPYAEMITAIGGSESDYAWSVTEGTLPMGLTLESATPAATLSGTPMENGMFSFTIQVIDGDGATDSRAFTLDVAEPALTITTTELPQRYLGRPAFVMIDAVNGTMSGYTWAVTAGSLPPGVTIMDGTPSATLRGVPTETGTFTFTIRVADDGTEADTQEFMWVIAPGLEITTASVADGRQGSAYDESVASTGGSGSGQTWDISAGALPPGLALTAPGTSVRITGTPTAFGSFTFTLRVRDDGGNRAMQEFTMSVASPPIVITTGALPDGSQGALYATSIATSGGSGSGYVWSVSAGSLPPGIEVRGATPSAALVGAASATGSFSFTLRVTDDDANTTTRAFSMNIGGAGLDISPPAVAPGRMGQAYNASLVGSGGSGAGYTFTRAGGALPPGLALSGAGVLSGTPSVSGAFAFRVQVRDSAGRTLERDYTIHIAGPQRLLAYVGEAITDGRDTVMLADVSSATPGTPFAAVSSPVAGGNAMVRDGSFHWSPDHRYFAFIGDMTTTGSDDLYVVDSAAGSPAAVNLTNLNGGRGAVALRWAPDSRRLAVIADYDRVGDEEMGIFDLRAGVGAASFTLTHTNVPGGDVLPLIADADNTDFDWSMDSTKLYFHGDIVQDRVVEAFMFDTANPGRGAQALSGSLDSNRGVARVIAAGNDVAILVGDLEANNRAEVFAVSTAGGVVGPRVRMNPFRADGDVPFGPYALRASPGGRFVAFVGTFTFATPDVYLIDLRDGVPPEGSALNILQAPEAAASRVGRDALDWSPRGDQLVFTANDSVGFQDAAFVVDLREGVAATGVQISPNITTFEDTDQVRWSPDGTGVVMLGEFNDDGVEELFYVNLAGATPGPVVQLSGARTAQSDVGADPTWLPDSSAVIYRHDAGRDGHTELYRVTVATAMSPVRIHTQFPAFTGFNSAGVNQINDFFVTQDSQRVVAVGTDAFVDNVNEVVLINLPTLPNLTRVNAPLPSGGDIFTGALHAFERRE